MPISSARKTEAESILDNFDDEVAAEQVANLSAKGAYLSADETKAKSLSASAATAPSYINPIIHAMNGPGGKSYMTRAFVTDTDSKNYVVSRVKVNAAAYKEFAQSYLEY